MHIETVPNRGSRPTILVRQSYREGSKVRKRTLANITRLPPEQIEVLRRSLRGEELVPAREALAIERSLPHGHVKAVLGTIRRIGLETVIASRRCRQRDLVVAMIAQRLIHASSKLGSTRLWRTSTLADQMGVEEAGADDLYGAMDWLLERQGRIEAKLAGRHLAEGGQVLYDVTSSYYEGRTCPLAQFGHDRDGKGSVPIIVYGVLADSGGRPVAVQVYEGSTGDPSTVPDQVEKLTGRFGLRRVVLVGDRGMLTETQIDALREHPQLGWISALRSGSIRKLVEGGQIQTSLFDKRNLAEIRGDAFPGERLIACFNPILADQRARKRQELLAATQKELARIQRAVARRTRTLLGKDQIGLRVGAVLGKHKMGKHFELRIGDGLFEWARDEASIQREAALDGIYVIRTSEAEDDLSAADAVRCYKSLGRIESAFRCMKGIDILVRPIYHRIEPRVRAHVFLCMLAYYVEWHMRRALAPMLFEDEDLQEHREQRDPVARAQPPQKAVRKKATLQSEDGQPVHSFETLLEELGTLCKNRCRMGGEESKVVFEMETRPNPLQAKAMGLLGL
jgi:transposase